MKTISLKLPPALDARLNRAARQRQQSKSDIVRAALVQYLALKPAPNHGAISALELAGDIVGCVSGPGDLSSNPKYLEGFGQ